jgi:DNA gyrase subunit A
LRFSDDQLRAQGRFGQGVAAISLSKGAVVLSASYRDNELVSLLDGSSLLVITGKSMVKKVPMSEFVVRGRATVGIAATELQQDDTILFTTLVKDEDTILFASTGENGEKGERAMAVRSTEIKTFPRNHKGVQLINGRIINALLLA